MAKQGQSSKPWQSVYGGSITWARLVDSSHSWSFSRSIDNCVTQSFHSTFYYWSFWSVLNLDTIWCGQPRLSITTLDYLARPKVPRQRRHSYQAWHLQGPGDCFPANSGKGQTFSVGKAKLFTTANQAGFKEWVDFSHWNEEKREKGIYNIEKNTSKSTNVCGIPKEKASDWLQFEHRLLGTGRWEWLEETLIVKALLHIK